MPIKIRKNNSWVEVSTVGIGTTSKYYSGQIIKTATHSTGWLSGGSNIINTTSWTNIGIGGVRETSHNVTRNSFGTFDGGLTYALMFDKISNNSHLEVTAIFPAYMASASNHGAGIRCLARWNKNQGSNLIWPTLSGLTEGPYDGWGAIGYGGNAAGAITYCWNTREAENSDAAQSGQANAAEYVFGDKTGLIEISFQARLWNTGGTLYLNTYMAAPIYNRVGKIIIREIAN